MRPFFSLLPLGLAACATVPTPALEAVVQAREPSPTAPERQDHFAALGTPAPAGAHVVLPRGAAWNTVASALATQVGLVWADPAAGTFGTTARVRSSLSTDGLHAEQVVEQDLVRRDGEGFAVQVDAKRRTRGPCEEPSAWTPAPGTPRPELSSVIARALRERTHITHEDLRFPAEGDVLSRIAEGIAPYAVAAIELQTLTTTLRETVDPATGDLLRSRLRIRMVPAESGLVRFAVEAELARRARDDATWRSEDAARIFEHGWAVIERVVPPSLLVLPDEPEVAFRHAPAPLDPPAAPIDTGIGAFRFFVTFTVVDDRPGGGSWDGDRMLGALIRHAPELVQIGRAVASSGTSEIAATALEVTSSLALGSSRGGIVSRLERMLAAAAAREADRMLAPDPFLVLSRPRAGGGFAPWVQLPVVADTFVAAWDPVELVLDGRPTPVRFEATDRDLQYDDPIASGTVDLLEAARRCEHVTVTTPGGTLRVLGVRRW